MKTKQIPIHFELRWNDSEVENPSIELQVFNKTDRALRMEVQWGFWHFDEQYPTTAADAFTKECPTGALVQWAEEMVDEVGQGESKSFFMFGEELREIMSVCQVLSPDLHCLWIKLNQDRYLLLDGAFFAAWLENNVVPLFEVE